MPDRVFFWGYCQHFERVVRGILKRKWGDVHMANICRNCGNYIQDGDMFCDKCGTPVNGMSGPPKKSHTGLIVGLIIGAVVIITTVILLFVAPGFLVKKEKKERYKKYDTSESASEERTGIVNPDNTEVVIFQTTEQTTATTEQPASTEEPTTSTPNTSATTGTLAYGSTETTEVSSTEATTAATVEATVATTEATTEETTTETTEETTASTEASVLGVARAEETTAATEAPTATPTPAPSGVVSTGESSHTPRIIVGVILVAGAATVTAVRIKRKNSED